MANEDITKAYQDMMDELSRSWPKEDLDALEAVMKHIEDLGGVLEDCYVEKDPLMGD